MQIVNSKIQMGRQKMNFTRKRKYLKYGLLLLICLSIQFYSPVITFAQDIKTVITDSARHAASNKYDHPGILKLLFLGKNYRKEWSADVLLPVFDLKSTGLKIKELAGGMQTKSLELLAQDGTVWVLRTIDKDVTKAVPSRIRNRFSISVVQDMVSAAHPYAPLIIPGLAKSTGIKAADPIIYFVPDDVAFGEYRNIFSDILCLLERKEILEGTPDTKETSELIDDLVTGKSKVDAPYYLKARLLDMLIGDWDRHQDQWRWARKIEQTNIYYPLPTDRDQALFYSQGLLVKIVTLAGPKHFVGFTRKTSNLRKLNAKSWNLDKYILNELSEFEWRNISSQFMKDLSDEVIRKAVNNLPPEVYSINGKKIIKKLISRRDHLQQDLLRYYRFLSRDVTISGTDETDFTYINGNKDSVTVIVSADASQKQIKFQRTFHYPETKNIRILGLDGNDDFTNIADRCRINIHIDGGAGSNKYSGTKNMIVSDSPMTVKHLKDVLKKQLRITDIE